MLITGATGMLGTALSRFFPEATLLNGTKDLDLTDLSLVEEYFSGKFFDTIIHTAAFTDLNYCKDHPEETITLHASIISKLSQHCDKLIYISTVPVDSSHIYFTTKKLGEQITLQHPQNLVIRTNIYGQGGLVEWAMKNLINNKPINGYTNIKFNAVHVDQLSSTIQNSLLDATGIVNVGGDFLITKYDLIAIVCQVLGYDHTLITPVKADNGVDLIVPLEDHYYSHSLSEGINLLTESYQKHS